VIDGKLKAVPRGVMIAGAIMDGARAPLVYRPPSGHL
jgi:hypothetical protein